MIDPTTDELGRTGASSSNEPLGSAQRLAGIELQLVRLNAQLRTVTNWIRIRETMAIVTRLVGFGIAIFVALTVSRFVDQLQSSSIFGGGSAIGDLQKRLQGVPSLEDLLKQ